MNISDNIIFIITTSYDFFMRIKYKAEELAQNKNEVSAMNIKL